jgi:NADH:ubiquinone oxidoreductase subunit 5 (subunit L)/multisubunit Na+/H+ antiporter MnhA subunit
VSTVWLIPALPLAGALLNMVFGRISGRRAHWIAVPAVAGSFIAAWGGFVRCFHGSSPATSTPR